MDINKKMIVTSAAVAAAATIAAAVSVSSAFGRIERTVIEANAGESISGLAGELEAKQRIEKSRAELNETVSGLDRYLADIKGKAAAITPASQQATDALNELQTSVAAMETAVGKYKSEAEALLNTADIEKNITGDGEKKEQRINVPLSVKWQVFLTNKVPAIDIGKEDAVKLSSGEVLANNIDSFMKGATASEKDNAYMICEMSLKKVSDIVEADKAAAAAAAAAEVRKQQQSTSSGNSDSSSSSGSSSRSSSSSSGSSSRSSSSSSGSSSRSSSSSSGSSSRSSSSSSGSSSRSSSSSSGSSSRSSSSGGSSSGGSSSGGSSSGGISPGGGGGLGASSGR